MTNITFVDEHDEVIGQGSRDEAIENGITHRIARIFIFNSKGELLIQKRSPRVKQPNKWDQSAAGHVDAGEDYATAASREAKEEVGLPDVALQEIGKHYTEDAEPNGLRKRFNMLYTVTYDGALTPDNGEVAEIKWVSLDQLHAWMQEKPNDFTRGFIQSLNFYENHQ